MAIVFKKIVKTRHEQTAASYKFIVKTFTRLEFGNQFLKKTAHTRPFMSTELAKRKFIWQIVRSNNLLDIRPTGMDVRNVNVIVAFRKIYSYCNVVDNYIL